MAYTWEPKWEPFIARSSGIEIKTCRDRITGIIACPICIHAASTCLGEKKPMSYNYENSYFYTVDDLINHLKNYHLGGLKKRLEKIARELVEEES